MDAFENAEAEMAHGICVCDEAFGPVVLMAIKPRTVCMIGGPGTDYCLMGRCFEVVNAQIANNYDTPRQPDDIVLVDYVEGSDRRTEVCRKMLAEYQESHRKAA